MISQRWQQQRAVSSWIRPSSAGLRTAATGTRATSNRLRLDSFCLLAATTAQPKYQNSSSANAVRVPVKMDTKSRREVTLVRKQNRKECNVKTNERPKHFSEKVTRLLRRFPAPVCPTVCSTEKADVVMSGHGPHYPSGVLTF